MTEVAGFPASRATAIDEVALLRREVEARLGRELDSTLAGGLTPASTIGDTVALGLTGLQIASLIPAGDASSTASGLRRRYHR
jgi:hypothetical protein